jgi:hypothetical protein
VLGIPLVAEVPPLVGIGLVLLRCILDATIRLIVCCLAVQAIRAALGDTEAGPGAEELRAHHRAVLQSIISAMARQPTPQHRRLSQSQPRVDLWKNL